MRTAIISLLFIALNTLVSCNRSARQDTDTLLCGGDTLTVNSDLLTLVDHGKYVVAEITDPWDTGSVMARYILINDGGNTENLPDGIIINVPVTSSVIYSGVHAHAIDELGAGKYITGVADGEYFTMPSILKAISDGTITDIGSSLSPSLEKLIDLSPQAILISPYQNAGHGIIDQSGAAIVEMADYMEPTPLGRAEWIKFIGVLYGQYDAADSIYRAVQHDYAELTTKVPDDMSKPKVVTQMIQSGVWYVPGGRSYQARMLADAGAAYPWSDDNSSGSLPLDFAAVYDKAHDARYWLTSTYGSDLTLKDLENIYPLNAKMDSFKSGGVFNANTARSALYGEFPFHPELLLREYINIFHPGVLTDCTLRYYQQVR